MIEKFHNKRQRKNLQKIFFNYSCVTTPQGIHYFLSGNRPALPAPPYSQSITDKGISLPLRYSSGAKDSGNTAA